ncbi:hypothetical protein [Pseudalkalibacillus hwajinpoensis]|uniref:hypothetical protein n=1 Tax=Guptibacillus hwajinpoensis TaxID=208199 RepID=UPI00384FA17E
MNKKALGFIKNFSYVLTSNFISLLIATLIILIIPKVIGVEEYGYWQLYLFYSTYLGFLHFGWNDGIYLRYGGEQYSNLNKPLFFSQFYMLIILQIIMASLLIIYSVFFSSDDNRVFIGQMLALGLLLINPRFMLLYILQGTNRIKEYAQITMLDKILYSLLIIAFLLFGAKDFKIMVLADVIGKFISLSYAMFCCREIVFRNISTFYFSFKETIHNINTGIKLMFTNIASMLIIGVVRFGIERSWDVTAFGKISLTLSISNLMMLFINAIGIVIFPILRRTKEEKLANIYITIRDFLMVVLLGGLVIYFPLKGILSIWLPQYADSLIYMALLFPICVYEGKMALLINTYLKTLRKEKLMLVINLISLSLSVLLTVVSIEIWQSLNLTVLSIVILLAFRCIFAEKLLSNILQVSVNKDTILELGMTTIFILVGWFIEPALGISLYFVAYLFYLILKKNDILLSFKNLKILIKK